MMNGVLMVLVFPFKRQRNLSSILCSLSLRNSNIYQQFKEEIESGDGERSLSDCFSDSCSTDESESDKLWRWDGCCSSEDGGSDQDNVFHLNNRLGYLYFQYFETSMPYGRVPLMDKEHSGQ